MSVRSLIVHGPGTDYVGFVFHKCFGDGKNIPAGIEGWDRSINRLVHKVSYLVSSSVCWCVETEVGEHGCDRSWASGTVVSRDEASGRALDSF